MPGPYRRIDEPNVNQFVVTASPPDGAVVAVQPTETTSLDVVIEKVAATQPVKTTAAKKTTAKKTAAKKG
jgi:topoisomerase IA-like protein